MHRACLNSRLTRLEDGIIDDGDRLRFTGQLTVHHADEHIRIRTYAGFGMAGRCGDFISGGEGIRIFIAPCPFVRDRNSEGQLLAGRIIATDIRTGTGRRCDNTDIIRYVQSVFRSKFDTAFPVITLGIAVVIRGTVLHPCGATVSSRVTDDVEQRNIRIGSGQFVRLNDISYHKGLEGVCLYRVAFLLQGDADRTECIFTVGLGLDMIYQQPYIAVFTQAVELVRQLLRSAMHTVMDDYLASSLRNTVQFGCLVIVVIIIFECLRFKLIAAVVLEERVAQGISDGAVTVFGVQLYFLFPGQVESADRDRGFAVSVLLHTI